MISVCFLEQLVKLENPIPNQKEKAKRRKYFVYKGIDKRCEVSDRTYKTSRLLVTETDISRNFFISNFLPRIGFEVQIVL